MNTWNPVFNLVMKIKYDYKEKFGLDIYNLETWIEKLNKKEYIDFVAPLQVTSKDHLCLIRYGIAHWTCGMWEDQTSIYRECRSVTIDLKNEELVLTPLAKFFNLNEVVENELNTVIQEIINCKSFEITDKLDGSMQCARFYRGKIVMSGSKSLDPNNSWRLKDGYKRLTDNHTRMISDNPEFTFIFEYISIRDAHVVKYRENQEGLYLIGMRNSLTGKTLSYNDILSYSKKYSVPMTEIENKSLDELLDESKDLKSDVKEGWVLNIDGHMIKLKCDDYTKVHALLDRIGSINAIIENIADNTFDDLLVKLPASCRDTIVKRAEYIFNYIKYMDENVYNYYRLAPKHNTKEFMLWIKNNVPAVIQTYCKSKYLNREINYLKGCLNSKTPKYILIGEIEENIRLLNKQKEQLTKKELRIKFVNIIQQLKRGKI